MGARQAAKAMVKAADAVAAPDPAATRKAGAVVAQKAAPVAERARTTSRGVKEGGKRFGKAVWAPAAKAGGVLWLEVTGVLFGLFALVIGTWVFNQRGAFAGGDVEAKHKVWAGAVMLGLFLYLTATNFLRARRRARA